MGRGDFVRSVISRGGSGSWGRWAERVIVSFVDHVINMLYLRQEGKGSWSEERCQAKDLPGFEPNYSRGLNKTHQDRAEARVRNCLVLEEGWHAWGSLDHLY